MQLRRAAVYLSDARFSQNDDALEPGLTRWPHDIVSANTAAHGASAAACHPGEGRRVAHNMPALDGEGDGDRGGDGDRPPRRVVR